MIDKATGFLCVDKPVIAATPPRRRTQLYGSCAVSALLVMPAALSIGVLLAGPADAQTTITSGSNVVLNNYEGETNFVNNFAHTISGDPNAVYGNSSNVWTLTNDGAIAANSELPGFGVAFQNGGTVNNIGDIEASSTGIVMDGLLGYVNNQNSDELVGTISGATYGIHLNMSNGSVENSGVVEGNVGIFLEGSFASVSNEQAGDIRGGEDGVASTDTNFSLANAGTIYSNGNNAAVRAIGGAEAFVANTSTGTISGNAYGVSLTDNSNTLVNSGFLDGETAVSLSGTYASVINNTGGTLLGLYGVHADAATLSLQNDGAIIALNGGGSAIYASGTSAKLSNGATGTISGTDGIFLANNDTGTISNLGTITGRTYGIDISGANAYVNNQASGDLAGYISAGIVGVLITGANGTVKNAGTILADNTNAYFAQGVDLQDGGLVSNEAGDSIEAYSLGVQIAGNSGTVLNHGVIDVWGNGHSGMGVELSNGTVSNYQGATIFGGSIGVAIDGSGTVQNYGGIGAVDYGVSISGDGVVTNGSAGSISATGTYKHSGIGVRLGGGTLVNEGVIYGAQDGVRFNEYGSVLNFGTISGPGNTYDNGGVVLWNSGKIANAAQGVITGYQGVYAYGSLSLDNAGTVAGTGGTVGNGYGFGVLMYGDYGVASIKNEDGALISGVNTGLDVYGYQSSLSLSNAGTIEGAEYGVRVFTAGATTIDNTGTIQATGEDGKGIGVLLGAGGYLENKGGGVIYGAFSGADLSEGGTIANAGSIGGGRYGVYATNTAVTLTNTGTITSDHTGVFITRNGSVTNSGLIQGTYEGLYIYGQSFMNITNQVEGTITGARGLETHYTATLDNAGLIAGTANLGMYLAGGGMLTNESTGTISGIAAAVRANFAPQTVLNDGLITSSNADGIDFVAGGTVTNAASGAIYGGRDGINDSGGVLLVNNSGTINGAGDGPNYGGVVLSGAGGVTNSASGLITGYARGVLGYNADTVVNSGTIVATGPHEPTVGVLLLGNSGVVNNASGTISGAGFAGIVSYDGTLDVTNNGLVTGGGTGISGSDGTVVNAGSVSGGSAGIALYGTAYVHNQEGGYVFGGERGAVLYGQGSSLQNDGTIIGGDGGDGVRLGNGAVLQNNAGIAGGNRGVYITYGGVVDNAASGTISGQTGIFAGATSNLELFVASSSNASYIHNLGIITGNTTGIELDDGGDVVNANSGGATGLISGGAYGINIGADAGTVINIGSIIGQTNAGIELAAGGSIENQASGGVIGTIAGGQVGIGGYDGAVTLTNDGVVTGGNFAVSLAAGGTIANGATGMISSNDVGIYGQDTTIENAGLVSGNNGVGIEMQGGQLTNVAGGTINGGDVGLILGGEASASNTGLISDAALPTHYGALIDGGAALSNLAGGTITGGTGVLINGDNGTLFNAGTITGTDGTAIAVGANLDPAQITLTTGSTEIGTIDGGGTDGQIFLTGSNTINNTIANFGAGSVLDVAQGANWTASGDWTVADLTNDGTFQPGVIGTALTLHGNFTQSATGVLQVVVTPTVTSQFIVDGSVKLAGNLTYAFAPGTYVAGKEIFLTATQGITGGFSTVNYLGDVPASLRHATGAVATAANLTLSSTDVGPTPPPTPPTPPKRPNPPSPPMLVTPADDALYAEAPQAAAMAAQDSSADLLNHATAQAGGDTSTAACAAAAGVAQANAGANGASMAARMTTAVASAFCGAGGWVAATGTAMTVDGAGDAAGYHTQSGGVLAGVDAPVVGTQARLGIAVGYDNIDLKDSAAGKADIGTTRIGLYGTQMLGRFTLAGDFMVGLGNDTVSRPTGIGTARTKFDSTDYAGGVQMSTMAVFRGLTLRPAAGIRIASAGDAAFAESGSGVVRDFAVTGDKVSQTSIQPYATLGISRQFFTPGCVAITPSVNVGYVVEAGSLGHSASVKSQDGTGFTATPRKLDGSAAQIGAGITAGKGSWSLYARYTAYVAENWSAQSGEAGLQVKF